MIYKITIPKGNGYTAQLLRQRALPHLEGFGIIAEISDDLKLSYCVGTSTTGKNLGNSILRNHYGVETKEKYEQGDVVKLDNGLTAKVLDDVGADTVFVSVYINGFNDPHKHIARGLLTISASDGKTTSD